MSQFHIRVAQPTDAPALADLARQYTYQHLTETERQSGFLTGSFAVPTLQTMLASVPGQLAYHEQELVGFIVNSRLALAQYGPLVQQISELLPTLSYQERPLADYQWFFYGPVLVSKDYRGQGLLSQLFQANQRTLAGRFDLGVAFIAEENTTSMQVHTHKLGLVEVGQLQFQDQAYAILVFPIL